MSQPGVPPIFRASGAPERGWWWQLVDEAGGDVAVPDEYAGQRFASQGDAESWVGEVWAELAEHGVAAVVLFEHERKVYGPMSLSA